MGVGVIMFTICYLLFIIYSRLGGLELVGFGSWEERENW